MQAENQIKNIGAKIRRLKKKVLFTPSKKIEKEISKLEKEKDRLRKQTDFYKQIQAKKSELQRVKKNLQQQNRRLLKKLDNIPVSSAERTKVEEKIKRNFKKKEKLSTEIFKKSDQYYHLKRSRGELKWENRKIKEGLFDPGFTKTQQMNSYKRLFNNNQEIQQLEEILGMDIKSISSEGIEYASEGPTERIGEPDELLPWELRDEIQKKISTQQFDTLKLHFPTGRYLELETEDVLGVISSLEDYERQVIQIRDLKKGSTPKILVYYDYPNRNITIG